MSIPPATYLYPMRHELEDAVARPEILTRMHADLNERFAAARSAFLAIAALREELRERGYGLRDLDGDGETFLALVDDGRHRELERRLSIWFRFKDGERSIAIELVKPRLIEPGGPPSCPWCEVPMAPAKVVHLDTVSEPGFVGAPVQIAVTVGEERETFSVGPEDVEVTFGGWTCASCGAAVFGGRHGEPDV